MKKALIAAGILFLLSSCSMRGYYKKLDRLMERGNCQESVSYLNANKGEYGTNAKLLFFMDAGMISMVCKDYPAANRYFQAAEDLGQALWTKSVSRYTASFLTNDLVIPYAGEDFERALLNLFSAISYLRMGQNDEALVECRRLDSLLASYNSEYQKKNVYKEDAFGRYLSGMIHEASGELDDAYIDYYSACMAYRDYQKNYSTPMPLILKQDLLRLARFLDRMNDAETAVPDLKSIDAPQFSRTKQMGRVVLINLSGKAPEKKEAKFTVATRVGPISIAFPKYGREPPTCGESALIVKTESSSFFGKGELAEDITRIAVKCLNDRKARIMVKAIARAVAKQIAIRKLSQAAAGKKHRKGKTLLEFALNTANTLALERADTRSWHTLPARIYLSSVFVPSGTAHIYAKTCGQGKELVETIKIKPGETRFFLTNSNY